MKAIRKKSKKSSTVIADSRPKLSQERRLSGAPSNIAKRSSELCPAISISIPFERRLRSRRRVFWRFGLPKADGVFAGSLCYVNAVVLPLDEHGIAFDPRLIDRDIGRDRAVHELAGADIELGEMQRAFNDAAFESAARQGRVSMPAHVAQRKELPVDIGEHDAFAVDRDNGHASRRHIAGFGDRNEFFWQFLLCGRSAPYPNPLPASGASGERESEAEPRTGEELIRLGTKFSSA